MITRRRRQGSESEHQQFAEAAPHQDILKGPSPTILWSGENFHQPSFFIVPPGEVGAFVAAPASVEKSNTDMALVTNPSSSVLSSTNASSRDRTAEFLSAVRSFQSRSANGVVARQNLTKNIDQQHQQYSEFMKVAK